AIRIGFSSPLGGRLVEACTNILLNPVQWATSIKRSVSFTFGNILYRDKLKFRASSGVSFSKRSSLSLDFSIFTPSRSSRLFEIHVSLWVSAFLCSSRYSSAEERTANLVSSRFVVVQSSLATRYSSKSLCSLLPTTYTFPERI